ncbi:MAG: hypothetical protein KGN78_11705 [Actinomycetales bacterium]|nr:hypothetical protein [Actinomycetales bacterium]
MTDLPGPWLPAPAPDNASAWAQQHLAVFASTPITRSSTFRGGQQAADAALASFDVAGYAKDRNEVWPIRRRGASRLSPYIRHGLLSLPRVWAHVAGGPAQDVTRFRDELLWQEYARHLYARIGDQTRRSLRYSVREQDAHPADPTVLWGGDGALCLSQSWAELREDGWLPNQTRMWLASHWSVRHDGGWRDGEDVFFRHLLDGSRAANRVGWQWTVGALTGKAYGFSQWQVHKRAPGLCDQCPLQANCPIELWPDTQERQARVAADPALRRDSDLAATAGPRVAEITGEAQAVWLTAESLGDDDPALQAHPDLPVLFVFDAPLLTRLRLAGSRLLFLTEALADLGSRREVRVAVGSVQAALGDRPLAAAFTPVPGWRRHAHHLQVVARYPWPWLRHPQAGPVTSFTAWSRSARTQSRG